jgi:hypothetical protein
MFLQQWFAPGEAVNQELIRGAEKSNSMPHTMQDVANSPFSLGTSIFFHYRVDNKIDMTVRHGKSAAAFLGKPYGPVQKPEKPSVALSGNARRKRFQTPFTEHRFEDFPV